MLHCLLISLKIQMIMDLDLLLLSRKSSYLLFLSIMKNCQPEKRKKNHFH